MRVRIPFPNCFNIKTISAQTNHQINAKKNIHFVSGTYTCAAQNVGGKAEIDIELLVGRDANGMLFFTNQMLFVLCLMAVGLLIVSLVIMIVTCCYCRKFKSLLKHDLEDGMNGISLGADGTLNGTSGKKHFQAIKLNSFNNAATMIGNGSCVVGNTMVINGMDDDPSDMMHADVIANKNGGMKIANENDMEKFGSIEFNHANIKSDTIRADTHDNGSCKTHHTKPLADKKSDISGESNRTIVFDFLCSHFFFALQHIVNIVVLSLPCILH